MTSETGGRIDSARGNVGRNAHPRALVAQCLKRLVALVLAVFSGQCDGMKPAFGQACV